jgi:hypothetical protein
VFRLRDVRPGFDSGQNFWGKKLMLCHFLRNGKSRVDEIRNTIFPISPIPPFPEERPELCYNRTENSVKYK